MGGKNRQLDGFTPMRVDFERASVTRAGHRILAGATLTLKPGTLTVVVGSTGSGKTTLLDLAAGLAPTGGVVKFDGIDVRGQHPTGVTVVTATPFLVAAPIRDNLGLGATYPETDLWDALRVAAADEEVRALPDGLDTSLADDSLRCRLALARAVLRRPRLLILDDATTGLDAATELRVLEGLAALDVTVLATAGRLPSAAPADQVVLLEAGRLSAPEAATRPANAYAAAG
ncbi:hypothetical protein Aab01nite_00660 [Paractinoplanes abujensis]|uniref:ABC-type multidrug transport system fused ATPase/permease subunit n=1 Tax=Paractinoplanes abujensis TaxID=882441 RepID=A0A7W7G101_9ACTN|nr:ATP-binding cassette domain-containing protein [Actinoplanes abujensis]MBB4692109.1 ABC-type multidrug transport system fused ATPase/permease subunit [Actinoplanes abujensis]GID16476.1 hypothetical protein Aab01nite_00660 [Actinoplanes abujensis]